MMGSCRRRVGAGNGTRRNAGEKPEESQENVKETPGYRGSGIRLFYRRRSDYYLIILVFPFICF